MNFSSRLIEDAVNEFSSLPGVGKKTALRFVLHLLKQDKDSVDTKILLIILEMLLFVFAMN
jgi:recombination protein RecR